MSRPRLTKGNIEFFDTYFESLIAHITGNTPAEQKDTIFQYAREAQQMRSPLNQIKHSLAVDDILESKKLNEDQTANMPLNKGWYRLALEKFVATFGKYGQEAISSIAEATMYANAFASAFGATKLFFRGEERYGYKLQSRAERNMKGTETIDPGLTKAEINELRRFQEEVYSDKDLSDSIKNGKDLPDKDSPLWLPIMQHYDEKFGTRLLDITSSVYAGLYFACVGWEGSIDVDSDGILYSFTIGNGGLIARGYYFDYLPEKFDEEMDNIAPESIIDSFKDWLHPEVLRLYKSSSSSDREIAQDGYFLTKGILEEGYGFGQGFKYRIPGEAKTKIAKELWIVGYTPERIVRGPKGKEAHKNLAKILGIAQ